MTIGDGVGPCSAPRRSRFASVVRPRRRRRWRGLAWPQTGPGVRPPPRRPQPLKRGRFSTLRGGPDPRVPPPGRDRARPSSPAPAAGATEARGKYDVHGPDFRGARPVFTPEYALDQHLAEPDSRPAGSATGWVAVGGSKVSALRKGRASSWAMTMTVPPDDGPASRGWRGMKYGRASRKHARDDERGGAARLGATAPARSVADLPPSFGALTIAGSPSGRPAPDGRERLAKAAAPPPSGPARRSGAVAVEEPMFRGGRGSISSAPPCGTPPSFVDVEIGVGLSTSRAAHRAR